MGRNVGNSLLTDTSLSSLGLSKVECVVVHGAEIVGVVREPHS